MPKLQVELTYTPFASKNRKFAYRSSKRLSEGYTTFVANLILLINNQMQLKDISWKQKTKTRVEILLLKSKNMTRTDASNLVDSVCDAVKEAIGVDDCWFAGSWDWQWAKNPLIVVCVSQP